MFIINEDNSIYVNRGDILFFSVSAKEEDGTPHHFIPGDVLRIKVYGKKEAETVVLEKDFPVTKNAEEVEIYLDKEDTKIGEVISKPKDYWYEVELNPLSAPQTIIGYGEEGACLFRLFPEGADVDEPYEPAPEDFPVVDEAFDLTSPRPVANKVIAAEIERIKRDTAKDYVAPEMFGAVGDGVADDTDAFQSAIEKGSLVIGKGKYKVGDITLKNVKVFADFVLSGALNVEDNVTLCANIENAKASTLSSEGRLVYVTGENNVIVNSVFHGVYCGAAIVLAETSVNTAIRDCVFEPCFKEDIHINGSNVTVDNCYFKEHTDETVSNLTDYSCALKVSYYLDTTIDNGKNLFIINCNIGEHGDNGIDCYSGAENVTISNCYINTPLHRCIEIKTKTETNHISKNYTIENCVLIGAGLIDFHAEETGAAHSLNNVIINNCHMYNVGNTGGCITQGVDKFVVSNCIIDANNKNPFSCDNDARIDNCHIYNMNMLFTTTDVAKTRIVTNCKLEGETIARITESVTFMFNGCIIRTTGNAFTNCLGKLILNNCDIASDGYIAVIFANTAMVGINFCKLSGKPYVFGRSSGATTGRTLLIGNIVDGSISDWDITQAADYS